MAYDHRIPSQAKLHGFSMVWLRAIALAWKACWEEDRVTPSKLVKDSTTNKFTNNCEGECEGACQFLCDLLNDPERAMEEWFNYRVPFAINFNVLLPAELVNQINEPKPKAWDRVRWHPDKFNEGGSLAERGHWGEAMPWTHFRIALPNKPEPSYDEAIAIAAFISSGPVYLFSCC